MEKLFCSKCGNEIEGSAMFCSKCGSEVVLKLKSDETDNSKVKNPFTKFIFITIAIQIIAIVIMLLIDGNIGGTAFGFAVLILPIFVLIFSVLTLIKSKKYNNKGKLVGIIFMILSFLLLFFLGIAVTSGELDNGLTIQENQYMQNLVDTAATKSVENLKDSLKDPSSLKINKIYAKVCGNMGIKSSDGTLIYGGKFVGEFEIYIDCTANNGFGGADRNVYHYSLDQNMSFFIPVDSISSGFAGVEIGRMPEVTDEFWVLDPDEYNNVN